MRRTWQPFRQGFALQLAGEEIPGHEFDAARTRHLASHQQPAAVATSQTRRCGSTSDIDATSLPSGAIATW